MSFYKIALSIPIGEAYGQTESIGPLTSNFLQENSSGHVGGPIRTCRLRLRDVPEMQYLHTDEIPRGEIQAFGVGLFEGYLNNPEKTKEAFTDDGWLSTGDVGSIDEYGRVRIIDRVKNIFKMSQGEYIAPEKL
jgi:long-chain acyl-CoA synthetase